MRRALDPVWNVLLAGAALFIVACASAPQKVSVAPHVRPHSPAKKVRPMDPDIVARSAVRFYAIQLSDGTRLDPDVLLERLASADAVCAGESHDDPRHHYLQLQVLTRLVDRAPQTGRKLALGLEMVQTPFQKALDAYGAFAIDDATFLAQSEWRRRWGFDFVLYRPLLELARNSGVPLIGLNAPKELTRKVAQSGLDGLSPAEKRTLPEMVLDDRAHRQFFERVMQEHPTSGHSMKDFDIERFYRAQVLWDETMAATASEWLVAGNEARQMLILAGLGHCHESAIPRRIERRVPVDVVSIRPREASEPTTPREGASSFDYELVFEPSARTLAR